MRFFISIEQFLCTLVQRNLDDFLSRGRSGWLIWYLLTQCTEPRKERSFFNLFGASTDKIAEVLLSMGEIPDCEIWYPSQSISSFEKWHFGRLILRFSSVWDVSKSTVYVLPPIPYLLSEYRQENNKYFLNQLEYNQWLFEVPNICKTIKSSLKSVCAGHVSAYCIEITVICCVRI